MDSGRILKLITGGIMKRILILLAAAVIFGTVSIVGAFTLYGTNTETDQQDIVAMLKDADLIDQPIPISDATYHIDETAENLPLIRDMMVNKACIYYYKIRPECNNTPLYALSSGTLIYNGTDEFIMTSYGRLTGTAQ
jgi:hypothetical protein